MPAVAAAAVDDVVVAAAGDWSVSVAYYLGWSGESRCWHLMYQVH